jgi:hypothetical protein
VGRRVLSGKSVHEALAAERKNLDAHVKERRRRTAADDAVEAARRLYGDVLSWNLGPTDNHCPVCTARDGNNFRADSPPDGELPGAAHPHCRCFAGPPNPGGRML